MERQEIALIAGLGGSIGIIIVAFIVAIYLGAISLLIGKIEIASKYGSFITSFATIGLVLLTGFYAYMTRREVEVLEKTMKQERQLFWQDKNRKWIYPTLGILTQMEHMIETAEGDDTNITYDAFSEFRPKFDVLINELEQQARSQPPTFQNDNTLSIYDSVDSVVQKWYLTRDNREKFDRQEWLEHISDIREEVEEIREIVGERANIKDSSNEEPISASNSKQEMSELNKDAAGGH